MRMQPQNNAKTQIGCSKWLEAALAQRRHTLEAVEGPRGFYLKLLEVVRATKMWRRRKFGFISCHHHHRVSGLDTIASVTSHRSNRCRLSMHQFPRARNFDGTGGRLHSFDVYRAHDELGFELCFGRSIRCQALYTSSGRYIKMRTICSGADLLACSSFRIYLDTIRL